jgi:hypothetical protein
VTSFKRALRAAADGYVGVTGRMLLNGAGDRAFGRYDFWSVCRFGSRFLWTRTFSYLSTRPGSGRIVLSGHC